MVLSTCLQARDAAEDSGAHAQLIDVVAMPCLNALPQILHHMHPHDLPPTKAPCRAVAKSSSCFGAVMFMSNMSNTVLFCFSRLLLGGTANPGARSPGLPAVAAVQAAP